MRAGKRRSAIVIILRELPGIFVFRFHGDGILVYALGRPSAESYVRKMCGRVRLSSDDAL
jgi:hypothetical protein